MRRFLTLLLVVALTLVVLPIGSALADKPSNTCPAEESGYLMVDKDGWWGRTVAGFEIAGIDVYEIDETTFTDEFNDFAADFGFGDGAGLEFFVKYTQWAQIDLNDNGYVCMKDRPHTPGNPPYFFDGIDDQASTKKAA